MNTLNDWIAVTPFPEVGIKTKRISGLALMEHTTQLQKLTVVFPTADKHFIPGDVVYLKADAMKHQWASEIYTAEDGTTKFILIPKNLLVGGYRPEK